MIKTKLIYCLFAGQLSLLYAPAYNQVAKVDTMSVVAQYLRNDSLYTRVYAGIKVFKLGMLDKYIQVYVYGRTTRPIIRDTTILLRNNMNKMYELQVPAGHRYRVVLSDSTDIWLNALTYCSFRADLEKERYLHLAGEVCIKPGHVGPGRSEPFIIASDRLQITMEHGVLNLKAYPDDEADIVAAISGSALVKSDKNSMRLRAGNVARIKPGGIITTFDRNIEYNHLGWTEGVIPSENISDCQEYFKMLERWYNIYITCDSHEEFAMSGSLSVDSDLISLIEAFKINGFTPKYSLVNNRPQLIFQK